MGKALVVILAVVAALGILAFFVGAGNLGSTAFNVPSTSHTPTFGITWTIIVGLGLCYGFYRVVKGK